MDQKLSCSATNCVHNLNGLCSANNIIVKGVTASKSNGTECETFVQKGIKNAVTNMTNMNLSGEFRQLFTNDSIEMSPNIKCDVSNCIYNENRKCVANNVQMHGPNAGMSEDTQCKTFKKA